MKRIDIKRTSTDIVRSLKETQYPHFIGAWIIENNILFKKIIDFFEENKHLQRVGIAGVADKNFKIKKTTDIQITPDNLKNIKYECLNDYINELYECYIDYLKQWPFVKKMIKDIRIGSFNIQKYSTGDHFSGIHTERTSIKTLHRVFAWMTYLNDVDNGGTTSFTHYDIKIKPEIGKTLIWPAEWTHAHNGEIINSGVKYIVTGWMHFPYEHNIEKLD
jgi:prolyl 4-hydroxylase